MKLLPIVYVTDMDRSVRFYQLLGFKPSTVSEFWSQLEAGSGAMLGLHGATGPLTPGTQVELNLVADRPLEEVSRLAGDHDFEVGREIRDEIFGRSLVLTDPDGLAVQVNEYRD
ncbi:MAG: VOC family protein [Actinomycetia bacterium]|nr:VOC family protein [Actinomycetes bacterium]